MSVIYNLVSKWHPITSAIFSSLHTSHYTKPTLKGRVLHLGLTPGRGDQNKPAWALSTTGASAIIPVGDATGIVKAEVVETERRGQT